MRSFLAMLVLAIVSCSAAVRAQALAADVKREFYVLRSDGTDGPTVRLSIIAAATRADAEAVLAKLKAGSDFSKLAQQFSIHPSKTTGGSLGEMAIADLRSEFQEALKRLTTGGTTGIIEIRTRPTSQETGQRESERPASGASSMSVDRVINWSGLASCDYLRHRHLTNKVKVSPDVTLPLIEGDVMTLASGEVRGGGPYEVMGIGTHVAVPGNDWVTICGVTLRKGAFNVTARGFEFSVGTEFKLF
jgi:hypothetical protein